MLASKLSNCNANQTGRPRWRSICCPVSVLVLGVLDARPVTIPFNHVFSYFVKIRCYNPKLTTLARVSLQTASSKDTCRLTYFAARSLPRREGLASTAPPFSNETTTSGRPPLRPLCCHFPYGLHDLERKWWRRRRGAPPNWRESLPEYIRRSEQSGRGARSKRLRKLSREAEDWL